VGGEKCSRGRRGGKRELAQLKPGKRALVSRGVFGGELRDVLSPSQGGNKGGPLGANSRQADAVGADQGV